MANTVIRLGKGAIVKYGATPTQIPNIEEITMPDVKYNIVRYNFIDEGFDRVAVGTATSGNISIKLGFDISNTVHVGLYGYFVGATPTANTIQAWEVDYPAAGKFTFNGAMSDFKFGDLTPNGLIEATITVEIDQYMTEAASS